MTLQKLIEEQERLIKLNMDCGCSLGICKKCSPIILIFRSSQNQLIEKVIEEVEGMKDTATSPDVEGGALFEHGWDAALEKIVDLLNKI
jgi:hypothetical protein